MKSKNPENRTETGKFQKGQSGNPGGRPKSIHRLKELAQEKTEQAVNTLVSILEDENAPAASRVSAATALLDRGYGRPTQSTEITGDPDKPLITKVIQEIVDAKDAGPS